MLSISSEKARTGVENQTVFCLQSAALTHIIFEWVQNDPTFSSPSSPKNYKHEYQNLISSTTNRRIYNFPVCSTFWLLPLHIQCGLSFSHNNKQQISTTLFSRIQLIRVSSHNELYESATRRAFVIFILSLANLKIIFCIHTNAVVN